MRFCVWFLVAAFVAAVSGKSVYHPSPYYGSYGVKVGVPVPVFMPPMVHFMNKMVRPEDAKVEAPPAEEMVEEMAEPPQETAYGDYEVEEEEVVPPMEVPVEITPAPVAPVEEPVTDPMAMYQGFFTGQCSNDGLYYRDASSFVMCSNGNSYVQPCATGSMNSGADKYEAGKSYYYHEFCDINMVDAGFNVPKPEPPTYKTYVPLAYDVRVPQPPPHPYPYYHGYHGYRGYYGGYPYYPTAVVHGFGPYHPGPIEYYGKKQAAS